nr:ubiquitin carboxyl-terminal hydrolase 14-like isoform X1 [Ipomoea batatas]
MELLRSNLSRVRIPEPTTRIYKHECCVSFDTPKSEGGLFVDMSTFLAFGKEYVGWNYEKTGNPVYLHIKQTVKAVAEDRPSKKPTLLAIGLEGGFDNNEPEYDESYQIVLLPDYLSLPFPSVELPEKIRLAVDAILLAESAERKEQVAAWTADKKLTSKYAMELVQLDNGVVVPPSGWKCSKCDKTENLWLNLTDGTILCGRRNWDGSGGNDHAVNHYRETGYPLAVKLGTITADLEGAAIVKLQFESAAISFFTAMSPKKLIDYFFPLSLSLVKTEMTTAERELDQNFNFDWNRIQETGQDVEPLFGPGYTGLVNLGNRYFLEQSLKTAFTMAPADPTVDLNMQLTKLAHGLLSGKYSVPGTEKQEGIRPRMFKSVIAANHPEFSTMRQQDALEFFLHFIDQVERMNSGNSKIDPSRSFKFGIEERIQCPSGKVAYNKRNDYILSLNIPLDKAINKKELEEFQKSKAEKAAEGKEITAGLTSFPDYLVLHMRKFVMEEGWVPKKLDVYIDVPDTIDISDMRSRGLQPGEELLPEGGPGDSEEQKLVADEGIVSQLMSMGFSSLHCQKAAINTSNTGVEAAMNWLLAHMDDPVRRRTRNEFSGELEPVRTPANWNQFGGLVLETSPPANWNPPVRRRGANWNQFARRRTGTSSHASELVPVRRTDIDAPISQVGKNVDIDQSQVDTLVSFGFHEDLARKALKASGGDIEKATDWIFNNPGASETSDMDTSCSDGTSVDAALPDGGGRYRLIGLVSHIGTSTQCGHYVAHIYKDGRWVIFNDEKVGVSKNPPLDMGYLYFFERLSD